MKNETTIATWNQYSIIKCTPAFAGRHFYYIARSNRCISRTFGTKREVERALQRLQSAQPHPILDSKINWLTNGLAEFGNCGQ